MYSEKVMQLFRAPTHTAVMRSPDGRGQYEDRVNGNMIEVFLKVRGPHIQDIKCRALGCIPAVAAGEMIAVLAQGQTLEAASAITAADIVKELGGLPKEKRHCAALAVKGLRAAIKDYRQRTQDV